MQLQQLVFATANKNKVKEIQQLLSGNINVLSLDDIGVTEEIPETQPNSIFSFDNRPHFEVLGKRLGIMILN